MMEYRAYEKQFVREASIGRIKEVDGLIFDCDGVLIDARSSYNRNIGRTTALFMNKVAKVSFAESFVDDDLIVAFRRSGGFNNDWDTTCVILLYLFGKLPRPFKRDFMEIYESSEYQQPSEAWRLFPSFEKQFPDDPVTLTEDILEGYRKGLLELASKADSNGLRSLEQVIEKDFEGDDGALESLKAFRRFLGYPGEVGESILTTAFEELFYGKDLFRQAFEREATIYQGEGSVLYEKPIVEEQALTHLSIMFGKSNLGVASGRAIISARRTLQKLLDFFNPDGMVFMEDEVRRLGLSRGNLSDFTKPNPYSLIKASKGISARAKIIYVGDSAEDLLAVQRANRASDRFLFAAVYGSSPHPEKALDFFREKGGDLIVESANTLPAVLTSLRGEGREK